MNSNRPAGQSFNGSADPELNSTSVAESRAPEVGEATQQRAALLRTRLIVAAVLSAPVMVLSMIPALQFPGWQWVVAGLSVPVIFWAASPFHVAAWRAARHGSSTMDTLVSLGVLAATLWSLWALLFGGAGQIGMVMDMTFLPKHASTQHAHIYFEAATMVTTFLLAGRYAEARARYRAGDALRSLLHLGAKSANRVKPQGGVEIVSVDALQVGDRVVVKPGEKIPTDGVVIQGHAAVDTSLLTGEAVPVLVQTGDDVTGATINTDGQLTVEVTRVGEDTVLSRIGQMVTEAQAGKAPVQRLADRVSAVFVPVVLSIALLTLLGWLVFGPGVQPAVTAAVSVLVIACPCALGLATPTALLVGSGRAAQLGIVIKGPEILEATRQINTILLDKTGTITKGAMRVVNYMGNAEDLRDAAAIESASSHPIAKAITPSALGLSADATAEITVEDFVNHAGAGVSAMIGDQRVFVGNAEWVAGMGFDLEPIQTALQAGLQEGATMVVVGRVPLNAVQWTGPEGAICGDPANADTANATTAEAATAQVSPAQVSPAQTGKWSVSIAVGGMTCASCVGRVERKLNKLPGVSAQVNLATETAHVTLNNDEISDQELLQTVERAGYTASLQRRQRTNPSPNAANPNLPDPNLPDPNLTGSNAPDAPTAPAANLPTANPNAPAATLPTANLPTANLPTATLPKGNMYDPHVSGVSASAVIAVADEVKDTSAQAIEQLLALNITPVLVTGDNWEAGRSVAREVGIEDTYCNCSPAQKRDLVADLQSQDRVVAMVGDGVNDAAALAQAGVQGLGMAMGSGTDIAIDAADITLMGSDLRAAPTAIRIARQTLRIIKQNLFWAFAYNVAAIPLAIAGLLNPMIAGAAMAMSSVIVVANSLRLKAAR